jgi:hypothetical protein
MLGLGALEGRERRRLWDLLHQRREIQIYIEVTLALLRTFIALPAIRAFLTAGSRILPSSRDTIVEVTARENPAARPRAFFVHVLTVKRVYLAAVN